MWAATDQLDVTCTNRAHDAVSTAKAADAWRQRQEFEKSERERAAKAAAAKAAQRSR